MNPPYCVSIDRVVTGRMGTFYPISLGDRVCVMACGAVDVFDYVRPRAGGRVARERGGYTRTADTVGIAETAVGPEGGLLWIRVL